uniref:Uncharacterized protein n=1 Tax=Arundo donax TaxID=35708 RepID=A0A0A9H835_ARUDO
MSSGISAPKSLERCGGSSKGNNSGFQEEDN